jgi:DNA-binding transcriptional regulator YhcF (GntR family)
MKLWLSKNGEVGLREQITTQIILAIKSGDLRAGEKLPSVREIALRYAVHPNTVSAAYHWLEDDGWVAAKRGSGVFVCERHFEPIAEFGLDSLISDFFRTAHRRGFSTEQIETKLRERLFRQPIKRIIVAEPDIELNKIFCAEIGDVINVPVFAVETQNDFQGAIAITINENEARKILPPNIPLIVLQLNSVQDSMRGQRRPETGDLVGIASGWEKFLRWSNTMLLAAGVEVGQIVLRNTNEKDWQKGLNRCEFVIADSFTAKKLPVNSDVRIFRLVSDRSLAELESLIA